MKNLVKAFTFLLAWIMASMLVVSSGPCSEARPQDYVETVSPYGYINWTKWTALAKITTVSTNRAQGREGYEATASTEEQNIHRCLFQVVQKVRINASMYVENLVKGHDMIRSQLSGMVEKAKTVKREYVSDGTVETTFSFDMSGGFAQLALPREIRPVPEIKTITEGDGGRTENQRPVGPLPHTGLVFDARGLNGVPAMAPSITNEAGQEIYGPAYVSREFAVQHGMASFETDLDAAKNNPRVAGNPLVVTCLKTKGKMPCDFIISNADASRIHSTSENLMLLKKCKVVIVLNEQASQEACSYHGVSDS